MCEVSTIVIRALPYVSVIAASAAAFFAGWQLKESRKATQFQVFDATFRALHTLEDRYYTETSTGGNDAERHWRSGFFNTLEYMSFLVNEDLVPRKRFTRFYHDAIIDWYENIFIERAYPEQRTDPQRLPELKKLYKQLKQTAGRTG